MVTIPSSYEKIFKAEACNIKIAYGLEYSQKLDHFVIKVSCANVDTTRIDHFNFMITREEIVAHSKEYLIDQVINAESTLFSCQRELALSRAKLIQTLMKVTNHEEHNYIPVGVNYDPMYKKDSHDEN